MECPVCKGEGGWYYFRGIEGEPDFEKCGYCKDGQVSWLKWVEFHFFENTPEWCYDLYCRLRYGAQPDDETIKKILF
jgi:hypothetical protein